MLNFKFSLICSVDVYVFVSLYSYTASDINNILGSKNFFDAEVYLQRPNNDLNSDEDSDSEEKTDPSLSESQLIAEADFRIDFGTHITNSLEAECDGVENVSDLQDEADLENEDNLEKQDFNIVLETQRSDLSGYQRKGLQNAWIN